MFFFVERTLGKRHSYHFFPFKNISIEFEVLTYIYISFIF